MVLTMDTNTTAASEDEDDDNNYEEESKESLIAMLKKQNGKLAERDLIIEDLKADLKREKKLNDMLIDQASYIRSLRRQVDITVKGQPPSREGNKDGDVIDDSMLKSPGLSQPITPGQRPRSDSVKSDDPHKHETPQSPPSSPSDVGDSSDDFCPLHDRCTKPAGVLAYMLNAFKNLPHNRTTLIIGDSNFHGIKGELDPVSRSTAVRSISGLCIVGAAHTLKKYEHQYPNIKRLVFSLGVNDHLHQKQHCGDDFEKHFTTLIEEAKRVFCKATINFIVPFKGLPRVPRQHIDKVWDFLQNKFPDVKRHHAPSMEGMVQKKDGVHLTNEGYNTLREFLIERFVRRKRNKPDSNHQPAALSTRGDEIRRDYNASQRVVRDSRNVYDYQHTRLPYPEFYQQPRGWEQPPQFPPLQNDPLTSASERMVPSQQDESLSLRGISEALASILHAHMYRHH